jgi:hypothetical protein
MKPRCLLLLVCLGAVQPGVRAQEAMESPGAMADAGGAVVHYRLPTGGPLPRTYLVTLAITDPGRPDWIVSTFATDLVRTVTAQNQGQFAETWNGLNDNGAPMPPGRYDVKGICMPAQKWAIDGQYHAVIPKLAATAGSWAEEPDEDALPQKIVGDPVDAPLRDVDVAGNGIGAVAFEYLENGRNYFLTDFNKPIGYGQIITGYESGLFAGASSTCTDGRAIWSFSVDGGPKFIGRADGHPFGHQHANRDNVYAPEGWVHALAAWPRAGASTVVFEAEGGRIVTPPRGDYVENGDDRVDRVRALDGDDATVLAQWKIPHPLGLVVRGGRLSILQQRGDGYDVLSLPLENGWQKKEPSLLFHVPAGLKPFDIEADRRGRFYLSDPVANHVYQLDAQGRVLRIFGRATVPVPGAYDPQSFLAPEKLACWTDAQGQTRLLVVEMAGPNRLSEWSGDTGALLRQWVTPQTRANDGYAIDPRHPDLAYVLGQRDTLVRWKIDYGTGRWTPDAVWFRVGPSGFDGRLLQVLGRPRVIYRGTEAYVAFGRGYALYHLEGSRLRACAAVLDEPGLSGHSLWSDRNGDGRVEPDELTSAHAPPGTFRYFGETWFDDLSLVCIGQYTPDIWRLAPGGFDARGTPSYDGAGWRKLLTDEIFAARKAGRFSGLVGVSEVADSFNSDWASIVQAGSDYYVSARSGTDISANQGAQYKLSRYVPAAGGGLAQRWRVGRVALAGTARPGEVYGPMFVNPPINGLVSVIDNSRAGVVLYDLDGLCVDTLFPDDHLVPLDQMGAYWQPGEFFAGQVYPNRDDGKIYFAMGKEMPQLFAAQGWSLSENPVRPVPVIDSSVELEAREIGPPPAPARAAEGGNAAAGAPVARFFPSTGGAPALDGSMGGWDAADPVTFGDGADRTVEVRCLYDPDHLYLRWHARLGRGVRIRPLGLPEHLFAHDRAADTLGLYLQGDPAALPPNGSPGGRPGDARFVFSLCRVGDAVQPVVLGMYPSWPGATAAPVTYRTPAGGSAAFANVALVPGAHLGYALDPDGRGFVLAAALPRAALPGNPRLDGWHTEGNFDANFGGHDRFWWSNADGSASRESQDEPTEARLYPGAWSPLQCVPLRGLPIRSWMAIGPFGSPAVDALDYNRDRDRIAQLLPGTPFPPDATRDFRATYNGPLTRTRVAQRQLSWRPAQMAGDEVDLAQTLGWPGGNDEGTSYLVTHILAPRPVEVTLELAHPDAQYVMRGWLNGRALPVKSAPLSTDIDSSQPLHLQAGSNELVLRRDLIWGQMTLGVTLQADPAILWQLRISAIQ